MAHNKEGIFRKRKHPYSVLFRLGYTVKVLVLFLEMSSSDSITITWKCFCKDGLKNLARSENLTITSTFQYLIKSAFWYGGDQIKSGWFASLLFLGNSNAVMKKTTIFPLYIGCHRNSLPIFTFVYYSTKSSFLSSFLILN